MKNVITISSGSDNMDPIIEYLTEREINPVFYGPDALIIRECKDRSRLLLARRTGTDRDCTSQLGMGRNEIMEMGLGPEDVTYTHAFGREMFGNDMLNGVPGWFYLVYDQKNLEPVRYEGKILEGNIWMPRKENTFLDALIMAIVIEEVAVRKN